MLAAGINLYLWNDERFQVLNVWRWIFLYIGGLDLVLLLMLNYVVL